VDKVLNPQLPKLHNTDGEPLEMHRLVFDIDSPEKVLDALKSGRMRVNLSGLRAPPFRLRTDPPDINFRRRTATYRSDIRRNQKCSNCNNRQLSWIMCFRCSGLPSLGQIFLGQRRSGRLGLHHDARNSPAAGFFDRLNAVDAARDLLAVAAQRVAAP
jgi:hypothetical protein